jgi:hypothetical protein
MRGEGQERPQPLGGEKASKSLHNAFPKCLASKLTHAPTNSFTKLSCFQAPAGSQPTTQPKTKMPCPLGARRNALTSHLARARYKWFCRLENDYHCWSQSKAPSSAWTYARPRPTAYDLEYGALFLNPGLADRSVDRLIPHQKHDLWRDLNVVTHEVISTCCHIQALGQHLGQR